MLNARWCSIADLPSGLSHSWFVNERCHVYSAFPSWPNVLSADGTETEIVQK